MLARTFVLLTLGCAAGCGDRAPPALWPEPPPPTLAKPLLVDEPTTLDATAPGTDGAAAVDDSSMAVDPQVEAAARQREADLRGKLPHAPTDATGDSDATDSGSDSSTSG